MISLSVLAWTDKNMGPVLVGPSEVTLPAINYNDYRGKFDRRFSNLNREQSLDLVLSKISYFDAEKAIDWKNKINQLWNSRKELSGAVFRCDPFLPPDKDHHIECTYRISNNRFLISADVFYRLPGFQQAYLVIQAMLVSDYYESEEKSLIPRYFDEVWMVRPYFSIENGSGDYLNFIKFFHSQFYETHSGIWHTEFQVGSKFVSLHISTNKFKNDDLLYPNSDKLFVFNPTRQMTISFLNNQSIQILKSSPSLTFQKNGQLKKLESGDTAYLIKNLNFADRLVTEFELNDQGEEVIWVQVPSTGNIDFTTIRGSIFKVDNYMVPTLYFENNLLTKKCSFDHSNCIEF